MRKLDREKWREWLWLPLFSVSLLWGLLAYLRRGLYPYLWRYRCRIPVLCIGNIHSGGSGKTPLVCAIAEKLKNKKVVVVSRGYKGRRTSSGAKVSLSEQNGPEEYGDEPWMLAQRLQLPVYVGKRRSEVLRVVEALEDTQLVLMDDGFQHLAVHRDLDLVLINPEKKLSERDCLPYGELREPLSALSRAGAICITSSDAPYTAEWRDFIASRFSKVPCFEFSRVFDGWSDGANDFSEPPTGNGIGFSGIASPESFKKLFSRWPHLQLEEVFADHHQYSEADFARIVKRGEQRPSPFFFTTEKDWVKVKDAFEGQKLIFLKMRYEIPETFWGFLAKKMGGAFA